MKVFRIGLFRWTAMTAGVFGLAFAWGVLPPAAVAQGDDPAALRDLVQRLVGDGQGAKVTLLPGKVADNDPAITTPVGWRAVGSVVRTAPPGIRAFVGSTLVFWDTSAAPGDALTALTAALAGSGWTNQVSGPTTIPGGFVPAGNVAPSSTSLCGTKGAYATVSAIANPGEATHVAFSAQIYPPEFGGGPCSSTSGQSPPPTTPPQIPAPYAQLPRLQLPAGAEVVGYGGGSGGQFSASNAVTIQKAPSLSDLDQIFSGQMQAVSWKRIAGAADPALNVSVWRKTVNGTDLQALLSLVKAIGGDDRVDLSIVVSTPASAGGPNSFAYGSGGPGIAYAVTTIAIGRAAPVTVASPGAASSALPEVLTPALPQGFAPPPSSTPRKASSKRTAKNAKAKPQPKK